MSTILQLIAYSRLGLGAASWALPGHTIQHFTKAKLETPGVLITRLFGAREFVLGVSLLYAQNPEALKMALQMGLFCDLVDVSAGLIAWKNGMDKKGVIYVSGAAALFAGLGAYLLNR